MRIFWMAAFCTSFLAMNDSASSVSRPTFNELAMHEWSQRDQPGKTEAAIRNWTQALQENPNQPDIYILLARAYGRAVRHAKTSDERQKLADQARSAAEKAVQMSSASAAAYAAYGEALGQWANAHKGLSSLSVVRQAVEALEKAISIDPKYAYAHMLLAEFFRQSPRLFSIGDKKKALAQARMAVEYGPGYAINHLVLARACLDVGQKEEGISELQKIMTLSPPADAIPETRADQETALAMLKDLGVKPLRKTDIQETPAPHCGVAAGFCTEEQP